MSEPGRRPPRLTEQVRRLLAAVRNLRRYATAHFQGESEDELPSPLATARLRSGPRRTLFATDPLHSIVLDCSTGLIRSLGIREIRAAACGFTVERAPLPGGAPEAVREHRLPLAQATKTGSETT
jgi:hypothetical protein